jgi:hypothetical protein
LPSRRVLREVVRYRKTTRDQGSVIHASFELTMKAGRTDRMLEPCGTCSPRERVRMKKARFVSEPFSNVA